MEGYCVICKQKQAMEQAKEKKTANGRLMMSGVCKKCGTKVNVFVSSKSK
jgi:hypothetical protein